MMKIDQYKKPLSICFRASLIQFHEIDWELKRMGLSGLQIPEKMGCGITNANGGMTNKGCFINLG